MKKHLIAPGPTPISPETLSALARPAIHHRGPAFKEIYARVQDKLKWIFQTEGEVLSITCSGTGSFEAVFSNFTRQGDTVLCIGGGKFSERWSEMASSMDLKVLDLEVAWGEVVNIDALKTVLDANEKVGMVTMCASETSSGVYHPIKEVARLLADYPSTLLAVDGITAVGVHDIRMDDWGVDIVISGSQKAFSLPPGLAFIAARKSVWPLIENSDHRRYYFDLRKEIKKAPSHQTAFTPASSLIVALDSVLSGMVEEGREALFNRHEELSRATIAGIKALGCSLFPTVPSHAVTALRVPDGVNAPDVVKTMLERYQVTVAGGQESLKPFLIRIGHMGYADFSDVLIALSALERALNDNGYRTEIGAGLVAAQAVFRGEEI